MQAFIALRLDRYGGTVAHFLKAVRCQLPAGIAVDAGRIDKKVALDICVETLFWIRHCMKPRSAKPFASASPLPRPGAHGIGTDLQPSKDARGWGRVDDRFTAREAMAGPSWL